MKQKACECTISDQAEQTPAQEHEITASVALVCNIGSTSPSRAKQVTPFHRAV